MCSAGRRWMTYSGKSARSRHGARGLSEGVPEHFAGMPGMSPETKEVNCKCLAIDGEEIGDDGEAW
jgi:hypothetical protein